MSEIHNLAKSGNVEKLRSFLESSRDEIDKPDRDEWTPLGLAVTEMVDFLLSRGANVHAASYSGVTPLHFALRCRKVKIPLVRLLLEKGADVTARAEDEGRRTALEEAAARKNKELEDPLSNWPRKQ
jgi:ankyrin repeat protein